MATAKVTLHTHDNTVSYDSFTPISTRARLYNRLGFDAIAPLGHDDYSEFDTEELITFRAIERTVSADDPEIHIVEIPELDFQFLAHPGRMGVDDVKNRSRDLIDEYDLDAIEKYNAGIIQYEGSINGVTELANDDAHNFFQTGASYMKFNVEEINSGQIVSALRERDFKMVNKRTRFIGELSKGTTATIGSLMGGGA